MELVESITDLFRNFVKGLVHREGGRTYKGVVKREVGGMSVVTNEDVMKMVQKWEKGLDF